MTGEVLFAQIERSQGPEPWGSFLDAGTGRHSLEWVAGLPTARWTAVTFDAGWAADLERTFRPRMRPGDRVLCGDWSDPGFLRGEVHDVVLADYLLGAIDGITPYFQDRLFPRLRPHVGRRLYVVGLEPPPPQPDTPGGRDILEIIRLRDACILLAGDRCYREYPIDWSIRALEAAGFAIDDAIVFPILYGRRFIEEQLEVALAKLPAIADRGLARALDRRIRSLRDQTLESPELERGIPLGSDYVIAARPAGASAR